MRARLDLLVALVAVGGCRSSTARPPAQVEAAPVRPSAGGLTLPRLDDADHELLVLDHAIAEWRARVATDATATPGLIEHVLQRASVLGDVDDYAEADRATAAWLARSPRDPRAHKWRAQVDQRLHRFTDARAELASVPPGEAAAMLVAIDQATGHAGDALPYFRHAVAVAPSPSNLLGLANALADAGRVPESFGPIDRAWRGLRGPTPFAVAALLFQWGHLHEQVGELSTARDRYELAWRAMPRHHEAAIHYAGALALTGDRDRAIEVLEGLLAGPDAPHPETQAALADLLWSRDPARARALETAAHDGWERYLAAEPAAFADHAARFYLDAHAHRDPARALVLAQANLDARATDEARALLDRATRAAR